MSKRKVTSCSEFSKKADDIMRAAQLVSCLEVCGYPKPGNVHRLRDFHDTRFEHFIAGSIAIGPTMRRAATIGMNVALGEIGLSEVGVGSLWRRAVEDVKCWHKGGNTHLGIIMLFTPLAISAGMCIVDRGDFSVTDLQRNYVCIVKATTCDDAIEACVAIRIAEPGGMGQVKHEYMPDLMNDDFKNRIIQRNLTLYDVMKFASGWDIVAWELVNGLETAFKIGYPALINFYDQIGDINVAIVNTFLKLLSIRPDTLIARKVGLKYTDDIVKAVEIGLERAMEVSDRARKILDLGGLATSEGRKALIAFDNELAVEGLNPGSTADVLASSIFIAILLGLKI